jgi:uncharacterized membrane protein HdeD (DUF308 family)
MSTATPTATTDDSLGDLWWIPLAAGVLSLVVGLIALFFPKPTLLAVGIIFGAYLVLWAVLLIARAASAEAPTSAKVLGIVLGAIAALAGMILIVRPEQSVLVAAWVLGFWWTLNGVLHLGFGIAVGEGRGWNIFRGVIGIAAGVVILAQPQIGLVTLVWVVGIGLILQGAIEIAAGWELRRLHKEGAL